MTELGEVGVPLSGAGIVGENLLIEDYSLDEFNHDETHRSCMGAILAWLTFRSPDLPFADHAAGAIRATGRLSLADRGLQPPPRLGPGNGGRLRGRERTRPAPRIFAESAGSGAVAGSSPQNVVWFRTIAKTAVRHTGTTPPATGISQLCW